MSFYKLIQSGSGLVVTVFSSSNDATGSISESVSPFYYIETMPSGTTHVFSSSIDYTKSVSTTGLFQGTFAGELSSSSTLTGDKLEDIFKTSPKKYTKFRFNEDTWNTNLVPYGTAGTNPFNNYFVFDVSSSIYGDYGNQSWRLSKPTKIRIDMKSLDTSVASDIDFNNKLFKIIQGKLVGSIIKFTQDLGENSIGTAAYKEFEIISAFYRESRYENVGGTQEEFFFGMDWGDGGFTETNDYSFYFDRQTSNEKQHYYPTNDRLGFFELEVRQINPTTSYTYTQAPEHDGEFFVSLDPKVYTREIYFVTSSKSWTIPSWAEQLEFYCVGAGGGGGGGASGYQHDYNGNVWNVLTASQGPNESNEQMLLRGVDKNALNEKYTNGTGSSGIGHGIITGGGGGAGGNIAYKVLYKKNGEFYENQQLTLLIGTGGKGGKGGHPSNDITVEKNNSPTNTFKFGTQFFNYTNMLRAAVGLHDENQYKKNYPYTFTNFPMENDFFRNGGDEYNTYSEIIRNGKYIYDGETGGKTSVLKNNGDVLVEADGGVGGIGGISLRSMWDPFHIVCMRSTESDYRYIQHQLPIIPVPGGGSRKGTSKGDLIRLGGAGGYGINDSVAGNLFELWHPENDTSINRLPYVQPTESLVSYGYNHNCAPNMPWDTGNTNKLNNPGLQSFPIIYGWKGEIIDRTGSYTWDLNQLDRYTNLSDETPFKSTDNNKFTLVVPCGGGGGTGKSGKSTWVGTEASPTKAYTGIYNSYINTYDDRNLNFGTLWGYHRKLYFFPPDKFNNVKLQYQAATKIGTGGINTVDTHIRIGAGSEFDIPIGNGGNGGHSDSLFEVGPSTILPQSGSLYGGGGGGGAGVINTYSSVPNINHEPGQDGGDGANGVMVIVASGVVFI